MLLIIIIGPKNSSFPAKAGETPMDFHFFPLNSEKKTHFPAFPALPAGGDTLCDRLGSYNLEHT